MARAKLSLCLVQSQEMQKPSICVSTVAPCPPCCSLCLQRAHCCRRHRSPDIHHAAVQPRLQASPHVTTNPTNAANAQACPECRAHALAAARTNQIHALYKRQVRRLQHSLASRLLLSTSAHALTAASATRRCSMCSPHLSAAQWTSYKNMGPAGGLLLLACPPAPVACGSRPCHVLRVSYTSANQGGRPQADPAGWPRRLTPREIQATVDTVTAMGQSMGINGIPATYEGFALIKEQVCLYHWQKHQVLLLPASYLALCHLRSSSAQAIAQGGHPLRGSPSGPVGSRCSSSRGCSPRGAWITAPQPTSVDLPPQLQAT
jgi:hypothetical protein